MSETTTHATPSGASSTAISIGMVTIDCADPATLSQFWAEVLGTSVRFEVDGFVMLNPPPGGGPAVGFQRVPEPRTGKNRVHLDLSTTDREKEVRRLVELGAKEHGEHSAPGLIWTILSDPEDNVFCVGAYHQ